LDERIDNTKVWVGNMGNQGWGLAQLCPDIITLSMSGFFQLERPALSEAEGLGGTDFNGGFSHWQNRPFAW